MDRPEIPKVSQVFAVNVFNALKSGNDSLLISPVSIMGALSMLLVGCREKSSCNLLKVLNQADKANDMALHSALGKLVHSVSSNIPQNDYGVLAVHIANRLFVHQGYNLLPEFTKTIQTAYFAQIGAVNFQDQAGAAGVINKWIEDQTCDKIKDMISPSSLSPDTRLVLVNAVYFKGDWMSTFNREKTNKAPFHLANGSTKQVDMMRADGVFMGHATSTELDCQALAMPFIEDRHQMVILLPNTHTGLGKLEAGLNDTSLNALLSAIEPVTFLNLGVPRFKVESTLDLAPAIEAMGSGDLFQRGVANLSGITKEESLFVAKAAHKTFLNVNEEGAEAAAATGMFCEPMMLIMEGLDMTVDHPFIVLLQDKESGVILFMGRVMEP